ncbi:MAG: site-2 protease family protein [Actinomycetota bacterium]|nr:site-2 protease family protein [Actinomycetota bacterium]
MTESFRLGRIAGFSVGAHWSVLAILALIAGGLAAGRLPLAAPGWSGLTYAAAGVVTALLFLASLLAHEVSHAVVARRNGLGVERIILWLFGGVAMLRGQAATPGADLRIAGVGPLVSAVLGLAFFGAAVFADVEGAGPLVVAALSWLAMINVILALFNLIPAAPLDGGRVLRAAVWRWTGDRYRAALIAARAGRVFGIALIGIGLAQVVSFQGFGGFWLALIGWFLVTAARAEEQYTLAQRTLAGVRIADVMTPDPVTAPPELSVQQFVDDYLLRTRFSALPLLDGDDRLAGLVTLNRIRQVTASERAGTRLLDIACPPSDIPIARPEEPLSDVLPRMAGCTDGRAVVVDAAGRLVGIVSPSDVARTVQNAELRSRADATPH